MVSHISLSPQSICFSPNLVDVLNPEDQPEAKNNSLDVDAPFRNRSYSVCVGGHVQELRQELRNKTRKDPPKKPKAVSGVTDLARLFYNTGLLGVVPKRHPRPDFWSSTKPSDRPVRVDWQAGRHPIPYLPLSHDDVIKWDHFPRYWPFVRRIYRLPVNSPHKGQRRGALMFSLICTWINAWVNNLIVRLVIWDTIALIMTSL